VTAPDSQQWQQPAAYGYNPNPPNNDWGRQPPVVCGPTWPQRVVPPQVEPPSVPVRRNVLPWIVAAVALLVAAGAVAFVFLRSGGDEPAAPSQPALTQSGAQAACRTAFREEWRDRLTAAGDKAEDVVVSVQDIELLETSQTSSGFVVNGTVHYTMTTGIIDPIQDTVDLRCTVGGTDAAPMTVVSNRS
jgi:hypothetical protein